MNIVKHIPIVWFTGLHRSAKGKQSALLDVLLIKHGCTPATLKGHGSRPWLGKSFWDPLSIRWQENYLKLKDKTLPNYRELRDEATQKLQNELSDTYDNLQKSPLPKPIILLDRTILSRYLTEKKYDKNFDFNKITTFTKILRDGKTEIQNTIIPDLIFVLDCTVETLLSRFEVGENETEQGRFRWNNIIETAPLFKEIIHNPPDKIKDKIIIIDGNRRPDEVHEEIATILMQKFPEYLEITQG